MIGVITTVVSFQTIHLVEEQCNTEHYCHSDSEHDDDSSAGYSEEETECPLCELKLPLITPVDFEEEKALLLKNSCSSNFNYRAPRLDDRPDVNYLRGPPCNS